MENILCNELSSQTEGTEWEPKVGDLAVNFGQTVRILEIGRTDGFGGFHPDEILVKMVGLSNFIGDKFYANRKFLFPAF